MRRKKRMPGSFPIAAGLIAGWAAALIICVLGGLALSFTDMAGVGSVIAAMLAYAVGSFAAGRIAGGIRGRGGLKTGALCGVLFFLPPLLLSIIFGMAGTFLLPVKALLCLCFAAAGGVVGVNSERQ